MPILRACCAALLVCLCPAPLAGQARHFRILDGRDGLVPEVVSAIAQDRSGLIWVGTAGGLFRYDGTRVERWAPDRLDTWVATITVSPRGEIVVIDEKDGALLEVEPSGVRDVPGPGGAVRGARLAVFDHAGGLWVNRGAGLMRRAPGSGEWRAVPLDSADGSLPRVLIPLPDNGLLVGTRAAVWRVHAGRRPERVADIPDLVHGLALPDGRILGLTFGGALIEFGDRIGRSPSPGTGRGIALAERNGTLWVSYDRSLVAVGPSGAVETLAAAEGISGSGPLLVDHEGGLWMGSWNGLFHFPEPDTRVWGAGQGLASDHAHSLTRLGDAILVDTWQGPSVLRPGRAGWTVRPLASNGTGFRHHVDREGGTWTGSDRGILRREGERASVVWPHGARLLGAVEHASGAIHIATDRGLLVGDPPDGRLAAVTGLPLSSDSAKLDGVFTDRAGRLWIAGEGRVCGRGAIAGLPLQPSRRHPDWRCIDTPARAEVSALVQAPSGAFWLAPYRRGVWRLGATGWEPIPGARNLPTVNVGNLVPSLAGGFWVLGPGVLIRVVEDTASPDGWRVEERLTGWHGLPQSSYIDVHEESDGTLWVASMLGVARVPASVRRQRPDPPRVLLVEGSVDEDRIPLDLPLRLPFERNRLRLRFAATSFRDPSLLRYQVRALADGPWETIAGTPELRWVDLDARGYRAEVRASLDGERWSAVPARFAFRVLPPWYRSYWALLLFASAAAAIAVLVHRARVAVHVELERQRTRIAMDLHDELGSGLGSIGILAGVLRSSHARPASAGVGDVAGEIGNTAAALGAALSDIVWALDRRSGGLDSVASRLAEHGNRLFANGAARFTTRFPATWPEARIDLNGRRNVLLIGVEALHNAARHSGARHVELAIHEGTAGWTLEIADDGGGLPADASNRAGVGLASMRRRAQQIDADLRWLARPGGGTVVRLEWRGPQGRGVRLPWRRRRARRPGKRLA